MTKCKNRRGILCDPPENDEQRCFSCPYTPWRTFEPSSDYYDKDDGLCYLDRTSPDDYEPEPIIYF